MGSRFCGQKINLNFFDENSDRTLYVYLTAVTIGDIASKNQILATYNQRLFMSFLKISRAFSKQQNQPLPAPPPQNAQKPVVHAANTITPQYLQDSWARTIQQSQEAPIDVTPKSAFEQEENLLNTLLPANNPNRDKVLAFYNALKANAVAGINSKRPFSKEENDGVKAKAVVFIKQMDQGIAALAEKASDKASDVNDLADALQQFRENFVQQTAKAVEDAEMAQQLHLHSAPYDPAAVAAAKEQLAQLIFLLDRDPEGTAKLLNTKNLNKSLNSIDAAFQSELRKILADLENTHDKHVAFQLQDPDDVINTQKPLAIARLLLTSSGLLNLGLTETIKSTFFDAKKKLLIHERDLLETLEDFAKYPELQEALSKITKPEGNNNPANDIIRLTLKLPPDALPTDLQAKTVALAALLSDVRQGPVGSCFATSVAIMMMGALKAKVLADFGELLRTGKITRKSTKDSDQTDFIAILDIGDSESSQTFSTTHEGAYSNTKSHVWDSPGLQSACRQLGIPDGKTQESVLAAIQSLYTKRNVPTQNSLDVCMEDIITSLVDSTPDAANLKGNERQERIDLAHTAFSTETNTSIIRVWESCLATMAEAGSTGVVRERMEYSVMQAFSNQWPATYSGNYRTVPAEVAKVQDVFKQVLRNGTLFAYDEDENIKAPATAIGDGHSTSTGAYVIYEINQGENTTTRKRVRTPEDFNNFILGRLKVTREVMNNMAGTAAERQKYQQVIDKIVNYVGTPQANNYDFVKNCIYNYDPSTKNIADPVRNYQTIEHLIFRDSTGNLNKPVYDEATGVDAGKPDTVKPKDAMELLTAFIVFGRKEAVEGDIFNDDNPDQRYMVNTSTHAFSVTPEDDSIVDAMKSDIAPEVWITNNLINPCKNLKDLQLTQEQFAKYAAYACAVLVPKEAGAYFNTQVKVMPANLKTLNQISNYFIDVAMRIAPTTRDSKIGRLSEILFDSRVNILPEEARNLLGAHTARFADTNWVERGGKHIYFAGYYNPITDSLQVGTVDEDGGSLRGVSQEAWVKNVPWDMYGVYIESTSKHPSKPVTV